MFLHVRCLKKSGDVLECHIAREKIEDVEILDKVLLRLDKKSECFKVVSLEDVDPRDVKELATLLRLKNAESMIGYILETIFRMLLTKGMELKDAPKIPQRKKKTKRRQQK